MRASRILLPVLATTLLVGLTTAAAVSAHAPPASRGDSACTRRARLVCWAVEARLCAPHDRGAAVGVAVPVSAPSPTCTPTESATPLPGLRVSGFVRLNDSSGPGLSGVRVLLAFSSYPAHETCTTGADGHYETSFNFIPGDEMIRVWAELEGFSFDPAMHYWRHWFGRENAVRDFVASSLSPTATPTATSLPVCTPPACLPGERLYCPGACPGGCGYQCATPAWRLYLPVILRQFSGG